MNHRLRDIVVGLLVLSLSPSAAVAADAVSIVSHGGTTGVRVLDLDDSVTPPEVVDLGESRVIPTRLGPQVLNDVKILPDGSHLVSGGDSVGLIVTDERGDELYSLSRQSAYGAVASASVGAYFSGAEPSRILLGSDIVSAAFVRQVSSERLLAFEATRLGELRGTHAEVIVLPDNAIAVAANYAAASTSTLDIIGVTEDGDTEVLRYSGRENINHPPGTRLDSDIVDLRDIHGFGVDTPRDLLVVTRRSAFRLAEDGSQAWRVEPASFGLGGEFASGVVLPSGRVALALFEPGRWNQPHPNHRIVWIEPDGTPVGAISGPLDAAPKSLDARDGHGGTGTTGFTAGLELLPLGDPDDLVLAAPIFINNTQFVLGSRITATASIQYDGPNAVSLGRARLVGAPALGRPCTEVEVPLVDFVRDESVTILSGEAYPLSGSKTVDSVFDFGAWCAWVEISDTAGRVRRLGEPASFSVVAQGADAGGEPIPSKPIAFGSPDAGGASGDASTDAGSDAHGGGEGCGCTSANPGESLSGLLLFLAGLALLRRRW